VYAVPYSDVFFSGSWSGDIKVWKLSQDKRSFEALDSIPGVNGIVNRIAVVEVGQRNKETFGVVAAVSKELRLGRWMRVKGKDALFSAIIPRRA
jgi:ribosomal RNA-processing protein 9